ncbi:hypothetical protein OF376_00070 [Ureaplasma miroungigenitalium]|uniref:Uncharacterized protein n=1 Tax=Ureaplasma miroungigenitalium TaxID=1042321 RepID=A0ABT3BLP0_9BACT|nr:hypothetical protein [Ureaplasma miroungigenitalium]MCV3728185.1 hypothetical protein [Ureaplasma miroungigenitalium]
MSQIKKKWWQLLGVAIPLTGLTIVMMNNDQQPNEKPASKPKTPAELQKLQKLLQEQNEIHLKSLISALLKIADDSLLELEKNTYDNEENKNKFATVDEFNKYKVARRFYLYKVKEFISANQETILKDPRTFGFIINAPHVIADNSYFHNANIHLMEEDYPNSFWGDTPESDYSAQTNPYFKYIKETDPQKIQQMLNEYDEAQFKTYINTYYNDLYNRARTVFFNDDDSPIMDKDFKIINDPNSSAFIASNPITDDPFIETWDQWIVKKITTRFSVFDLEQNNKIIEPKKEDPKKPEKPDKPDEPSDDLVNPPVINDTEIKDLVSDQNDVINKQDAKFINDLKKVDIFIHPEITPDKYHEFVKDFQQLKKEQKLNQYFLVNYPLNDFIEYRLQAVRLNELNEIVATVSVFNNIKKTPLAFDEQHKTYDIVIWNTSQKHIQQYLSKNNVFSSQLNKQYYELIYYTNQQMSTYFFPNTHQDQSVAAISQWFDYQKEIKNVIIDHQPELEKKKLIEHQKLVQRERLNLNILNTYYYRMVNLPSFQQKYLAIINEYYKNDNLTNDQIQEVCIKSTDLLLDYFKAIRLQTKTYHPEDNLMHESINIFQQTYNFVFSLKKSKYQNDLKNLYIKITKQVNQFYNQARRLSLQHNMDNAKWFAEISSLLQKAKQTLLKLNYIEQTLRWHENEDLQVYEKYAQNALSELQALWKTNQHPNYQALYAAIPISIILVVLIIMSSLLYIKHKKTLFKKRGIK